MDTPQKDSAPDDIRDPESAAFVAAIEARGTRHEVPCGAGMQVWRRWGSGPAVVLLHGGAGAWSHWIRNIDALAQHYTVWAVDNPGFGHSAPPKELSMMSMADAVECGVRTLIPEPQRVSIVAFSFGSSIAAVVAMRLKERLANFVLIGSRFTHFSPRPPIPLVSWRKLPDPAAQLAAHRTNLGLLMMGNPANIDALALYLQSTNTRRARISGRKWKPNSNDTLHEYFPLLRAQGKVTVMFGQLDIGAVKLIETNGAALQGPQPGSHFHIVRDAGHWAQYEDAPQVNALLLEALAGGWN